MTQTTYFKKFGRVDYLFGDELNTVRFQNISEYVDLVDQLRDQTSFYEDYTIVSGSRPDTLSYELYGDVQYYWTFFLLNDKLRESGWPIPSEEILEKAQLYYPHRTTTSEDFIGEDFPVGTQVSGVTSGTIGDILKRNLDLGQLVIDTTSSAIQEARTETLSVNTNGVAELTLVEDNEFFANIGEWVSYKDGIVQNNISVVLSEIDKKASFSNFIYGDSAVYTADIFVDVRNAVDNNFGQTEALSYLDTETGLTKLLSLTAESEQYNAPHHYVDSNNERVDVDPYSTPNPFYTPVTVLENLTNVNEDLKRIKVFKKDVIQTIAKEFSQLLG